MQDQPSPLAGLLSRLSRIPAPSLRQRRIIAMTSAAGIVVVGGAIIKQLDAYVPSALAAAG